MYPSAAWLGVGFSAIRRIHIGFTTSNQTLSASFPVRLRRVVATISGTVVLGLISAIEFPEVYIRPFDSSIAAMMSSRTLAFEFGAGGV